MMEHAGDTVTVTVTVGTAMYHVHADAHLTLLYNAHPCCNGWMLRHDGPQAYTILGQSGGPAPFRLAIGGQVVVETP